MCLQKYIYNIFPKRGAARLLTRNAHAKNFPLCVTTLNLIKYNNIYVYTQVKAQTKKEKMTFNHINDATTLHQVGRVDFANKPNLSTQHNIRCVYILQIQ